MLTHGVGLERVHPKPGQAERASEGLSAALSVATAQSDASVRDLNRFAIAR